MGFVLFVIFIAVWHLYLDIDVSFAVLFLPLPKRKRHIEQLSRATADFVLFCCQHLLQLRVNHEHSEIDIPAQCIVVANHQSLLDIYINLQIFTGQSLRFVAKKELARSIPGVSEVLRYGHHCLINRQSHFKETASVLRTFAQTCQKQKLSPCIFPEGTRSRDGRLKPFNPGAYRILQRQLKLPTLVFAVDGGWKYSHFMDLVRKDAYIYRSRILAVLDAPQSTDDIRNRLNQAQHLIAEQLVQWRMKGSSNAT